MTYKVFYDLCGEITTAITSLEISEIFKHFGETKVKKVESFDGEVLWEM